MRKATPEISLDAWNMPEVGRFSIPAVEPDKNTQHFCRALRPEDRVGSHESLHVEIRVSRAALAGIARQKL